MKKMMLFLAVLVGSFSVASGDTGTYRIEDYRVKLTPHADGITEIEYYQKWNVTGGHIPWITVGTPNGRFDIASQMAKGNTRAIKNDSQGSWSGVRIDLDKDYKPGQSFEVQFTIVQHKLFYADTESFCLDFTPGWYDNCEIGRLSIEVVCFAKAESVKTKPPAQREEQSFKWVKQSLRKGEKFSISLTFPKELFPQGLGKSESGGGGDVGTVLVILVIVVIAIVAIVVVISAISYFLGDTEYGGGPTIHSPSPGRGRDSPRDHGTTVPPLGRSPTHRSSGGLSTGHGGGFSHRTGSFSSCACVSCACACACAGGGGAGCDRKSKMKCPLCKECPHRDTCPMWR